MHPDISIFTVHPAHRSFRRPQKTKKEKKSWLTRKRERKKEKEAN